MINCFQNLLSTSTGYRHYIEAVAGRGMFFTNPTITGNTVGRYRLTLL